MNGLLPRFAMLPYKSTTFHTNSVCARHGGSSPFMIPPCRAELEVNENLTLPLLTLDF
jgi:hypothetical protein